MEGLGETAYALRAVEAKQIVLLVGSTIPEHALDNEVGVAVPVDIGDVGVPESDTREPSEIGFVCGTLLHDFRLQMYTFFPILTFFFDIIL